MEHEAKQPANVNPFREVVNKRPEGELIYRFILWTVAGGLVARLTLYSKTGEEFREAFLLYSGGVIPTVNRWFGVVTCLGLLVYALRCLQIRFLPKLPSKGCRAIAWGFILKVSADLSFSTFNAMSSASAVVLLMPRYVPASAGDWALWAITMVLLILGLLLVGASALAPTVDASHRLFGFSGWFVESVFKLKSDHPKYRVCVDLAVPVLIVAVGFLYALALYLR